MAFICNHCPYVKHIAPAFAQLAKEYQAQGVAVVAINSNDFAHYPDDSPAKMKDEIAARGYTFPYLVDETQQVAKAYRAACTPDFFLFDEIASSSIAARWTPAGPATTSPSPAGPSRGDRRGSGRPARGEGPAAEHRLQHQVAAGQRNRSIPGSIVSVPPFQTEKTKMWVFRGWPAYQRKRDRMVAAFREFKKRHGHCNVSYRQCGNQELDRNLKTPCQLEENYGPRISSIAVYNPKTPNRPTQENPVKHVTKRGMN